MKSCDHSRVPFDLSNANNSRLELVAKIRLPTTSGVLCGPAPWEKSTPSVVEGYLNSHTVLPVAASSATTTSSWLRREGEGRPGRYIVYKRGPSARIDEWPFPNGRDHSFFGPPAGQVEASPVASDMKFRCGPPHYVQVFSLPTPPIEVFATPSDAVDLARAANDGMADLVRRYPDRFAGFVAALPLNDPDAAVRELRRALTDLGARGFQMYTNVLGKPISAPEFHPLFETMVEHDLPIWLHPYRGADMSDYKTEALSQYEIWWTFGWPYETSVAMARLVFDGCFDRFPTLKVITHHMGAMAPYFAGRVGPGWDQLGA